MPQKSPNIVTQRIRNFRRFQKSLTAMRLTPNSVSSAPLDHGNFIAPDIFDMDMETLSRRKIVCVDSEGVLTV
jgi:hypothetical protein